MVRVFFFVLLFRCLDPLKDPRKFCCLYYFINCGGMWVGQVDCALGSIFLISLINDRFVFLRETLVGLFAAQYWFGQSIIYWCLRSRHEVVTCNQKERSGEALWEVGNRAHLLGWSVTKKTATSDKVLRKTRFHGWNVNDVYHLLYSECNNNNFYNQERLIAHKYWNKWNLHSYSLYVPHTPIIRKRTFTT